MLVVHFNVAVTGFARDHDVELEEAARCDFRAERRSRSRHDVCTPVEIALQHIPTLLVVLFRHFWVEVSEEEDDVYIEVVVQGSPPRKGPFVYYNMI